MNRIWVGTVDDIDNTHVELKAKKFGCPTPLIKADDPVQLKTLDIRTLIGPGSPVAVFVPQPQIRSRSPAGAILVVTKGSILTACRTGSTARIEQCVCHWSGRIPAPKEDHTWLLRLT